ncbi:MAG: von Willebrand factor type A domain-containing protein [Propionibacteriaceae bacterium]|nr:von Willebrand factor type A domain-containing protein [Propionibacteriaceae bacterium]
MKTKNPWIIAGIAAIVLALAAGCSGGSPSSPYEDPYYEDEWRYEEMDPQEEYNNSEETPFKNVATSPLSTFSSDVDTASYSNMRRQINARQAPQGVRIEELVNYFDYDYPAPSKNAEHPFTVTTEVADCPWEPSHQLAMIGVQATRSIPTSAGNNIVFLIDVSGSMESPNKLPLLIDSFSLMVGNLTDTDVVSIVTYAGSNKIAADSIPGSNHKELLGILKSLKAGGSTGGAAGIKTAYELAAKNFIEGGNNRVILATDGDFNVGPSTDEQLISIIEERRALGIYISVLGFGAYNLKDSKMEAIADHGNGNYAYIDTLNEAKKVLVDEFDSTMFVVAQDLKLQVEFNGGVVEQYRLIGYNNRRLDDEDFANDKKDAGDVGAGHSVTAFYELILTDGASGTSEHKYGETTWGDSTDYFTVSVRYKNPGEETSILVENPVADSAYTKNPSVNFQFASAVTEFGLILIDSQYQSQASIGTVISAASAAVGEDPYGLRAEFIDLVKAYERLQ